MRLSTLLPAGLALTLAAHMLAPNGALAFTKTGRSLDAEDQRDFRVFNNFQDAQANDNTTPDPNFPGQTGAPLAIWKAAVEWGSEPFGDGSGDPTQANLGDGGANFDFSFAGLADGPGGSDDNIVSAGTTGLCSGGVVSYVQLGADGRWRIVICDQFVWDDGPGENDPGTFDLQGILAHEFGIVLGLGSSSVPGATMFPILGGPSTLLRSIEADDSAGVQCIYGVKAASKPSITGVSLDATSGLLTIDGVNFSATGNEVWFTRANASSAGSNPKLAVTGVTSSGGGTQIVLTPPEEAGDGNVLVKQDRVGHQTLSNAFPVLLESGSVTASCTNSNGSGVNPDVFSCLTTPVLGTTWQGQVDGTALGASGTSLAVGYMQPLAPFPTAFGELLVDPTSGLVIASLATFTSGLATHSVIVPSDPALEGLAFSVQVYLPSVTSLTNRIDLVVGSI